MGMKITYVNHCGNDLSVVNAARVSFNKFHEEWGGEKDGRLIHYLARHNHKSPFNHCFLSCHVKAPIFVARQLVKHEYMPWNEVSRRYVNDEPEFYWPEKWRGKSEDKKQGSSDESIEVHEDFTRDLDKVSFYYNRLLKWGVAPEQARMILPLNTYTEWYWSGTLGAWMKMYNLRIKGDTQWETRQIAQQAGEIIKEIWPVSFEALKND